MPNHFYLPYAYRSRYFRNYTIDLVEVAYETDSGIVMFRVIEKKATLEIETIEIDNSSIAIKKKLRINILST